MLELQPLEVVSRVGEAYLPLTDQFDMRDVEDCNGEKDCGWNCR
jgi:hypothetical protein